MDSLKPTICAEGLGFPEGPVWCSNGDMLLVDIHGGNIIRVNPDGATNIIAHCGGGPNGLAVGPDAKLYVCNNGGFEWIERRGRWFPGAIAEDYKSGSIQRVDPSSGAIETLYTHCSGRQLRGPNDLIFDKNGGFWFTDLGKTCGRTRDLGALYYARPDGEHIVEVGFPLDGPNGIAIAPDESRLFIAETYSGRVFYWDLDGPGEVRRNTRTVHGGHYFATVTSGLALDSMAVDNSGCLCIAAPGHGGGIVIFRTDGTQSLIETGDAMTTNICFGGPNLRTAFITLSLSGRLVSVPWETTGHQLAFNL